jgi:multicomponent Na+:H+ antiporter subunit E
MKTLWSRAALVIAIFALWLMVTSPPSPQEMLFGAAIALLLACLPLPGAGIWGEFSLVPKKVAYSALYLAVFLGAIVKSNLDVAFRVLAPSLPINPGIVTVKTRLKSKIGRLALANSITLTPGTITVDIVDDELAIHWINVSAQDTEKATEEIVAGFEKYLEVIFG